MPGCDICNKTIEFSEGYLLTTAQVVVSEKHWSSMLDTYSFSEDILLMYVRRQATKSTSWLICEDCSKAYNFDRDKAREYAKNQANHPRSGPADIRYAATIAAIAWKNKYGTFPSWAGEKFDIGNFV